MIFITSMARRASAIGTWWRWHGRQGRRSILQCSARIQHIEPAFCQLPLVVVTWE